MEPFLQLTDLLNDLIHRKGTCFKTILNKKSAFRRFFINLFFLFFMLFLTIYCIKHLKHSLSALISSLLGALATFLFLCDVCDFFKPNAKIVRYGDYCLDEKSLKTILKDLIDQISSHYPNVLIVEQHDLDPFNLKYILYFIPSNEYYSIYGNKPEKALKNLTILSKLTVQVKDDKNGYKRIVKFDKNVVLEKQEKNNLSRQPTAKILHKLEDNIINWLYYYENIKELKNK